MDSGKRRLINSEKICLHKYRRSNYHRRGGIQTENYPAVSLYQRLICL